MKDSEVYIGRLVAEERDELKEAHSRVSATRELPMPEAVHVRAAETYFSYVLNDKKLESVRRILMKAGKFKIEMKSGVILGWTGKLQ